MTMLDDHKQILKEQYNFICKIKKPRREIDIPILIKWLKEDTGLITKQLADETGYSESYLNKIMNESKAPEEIQKAFNLLMLFFINTNRNIPIIGQDN